MLRPVRDGSAAQSAAGQLSVAITLGIFDADEHLPSERELAQRLGVSRMTVREAISELRTAGMVTTTRGRRGGTVVSGLDVSLESADVRHCPATHHAPGAVDDVISFRRVVEAGAAAAGASSALTAEQRAWLRACLSDVESAPLGVAHRTADARLHLAVAALAGSAMLIEAVIAAQAAIHPLISGVIVDTDHLATSARQHAAIVEAILANQPERARQQMEQHCDATAELLRRYRGQPSTRHDRAPDGVPAGAVGQLGAVGLLTTS